MRVGTAERSTGSRERDRRSPLGWNEEEAAARLTQGRKSQGHRLPGLQWSWTKGGGGFEGGGNRDERKESVRDGRQGTSVPNASGAVAKRTRRAGGVLLGNLGELGASLDLGLQGQALGLIGHEDVGCTGCSDTRGRGVRERVLARPVKGGEGAAQAHAESGEHIVEGCSACETTA